MFKKIFVLFAPLILSFSYSVSAQDRLFTYTQQSNVLENGQKELEISNTFRTGKSIFYNRLDNRTEFEVGLGKNVQTAFYLNFTSMSFEENNSGVKSISSEHELSFANEWKYKISDPVANPLGFALYGEYTIGAKEYDAEFKIILDKKIKDITMAFNLVGEIEYEAKIDKNEFGWNKNKKVELYYSLAYQLTKNFHLTFEAINRNLFDTEDLQGSALFAGLGFSYVKNSFWVNFTVLPQITSFKGATNNNLNLKDYEKLETRLIFSYEF
ncbi:hypothetical protein D4R20_00710 [bacterium]|nr:MAG: hypothetical protein D4R20_00710 [bacterium]